MAQVNKPTDLKFKDQDVARKLQFFGIYNGFAQGKAPSNKQIDVALNSFLESKALTSPPAKLSDEGKHLIQDVRDVVEQAKLLLLSKNDGNLIQEFIWETQAVTGGDAKLPGAPVTKDTAKQHGNEAAEGLRTLARLIVSNGQFRKLLNDAAIIIRSIAGDAATKAANKVQPSQADLEQVDEAAEDNVWHDTPGISDIKGQIRDKYQANKVFGKKDVQNAVGDASQAAHPEGSRDPTDVAAQADQAQQQPGASSGLDFVGGAQSGVESLKQTAKENTPSETLSQKERAKAKAREYNERTQAYLKGKMPKERRDQTIWRLKKLIVEVQGHADYQRAVETLLRLAEEYTGHTRTIAAQGKDSVKGVHTDDHLKQAEDNLKLVLERFANGTSSVPFFESLDQIYTDADQDAELKGWFKKIDRYIRRALQEQGFILTQDADEEAQTLRDQGNYLLRNKYRSHTNRILDEIKFFATQFDEDAQNKSFGRAVTKLFQDLGNDENGKPTLKPHLWKDVSEILLPQFLENFHYVPLPRIEYSDPQVDLIVENLIVESDNLAPNSLELTSDNHFKWGRKTFASARRNRLEIAVSGVQADLRDVSFYVNRKQGFPSIRDQGLFDLSLAGDGLSFKISLITDSKQDGHFFKVDKVKVKVKSFNIKLKQSKHKLLFSVAKPVLLRVLRPALQKAIEKAIREKANDLDGMFYKIHKDVQNAKRRAAENPDPENVQNIFQQYWNSYQQYLLQAKEKAEKVKAKADNTQVNFAMTKADSIFPDVALPSGISTKATEFKELSQKGERWESPVFSIGTAGETAHIPAPPKIERKKAPVNRGSSVGSIDGAAGISDLQSTPADAFAPKPTNGLSNGLNGAHSNNGTNGTNGHQAQPVGTFNPVNA